MAIKSFRDLDIWQRSMALTESIYRITDTFPRSEVYGLSGQMRRAAVSVPSNIAEGFGRSGPNEYRQYLYMAHGSLAELMTQVMLAIRLGYLNQEKGNETVDETEQISRMTATLIKRVGEAAAAGD